MPAVRGTTELGYTAHKSLKGLGTIGRAMLVHTTLAVSVARVLLGIIKQ